MFYYSMLMHPGQTCLEHSVFLKVKCLLTWPPGRSEERRVGKSVDLGGRRIIKKKKK